METVPGGDGGIFHRIPVWDGQPHTWRQFEKDVNWFLAGEDLSRISFNFAVRIINKQTGTVKRRGGEFDPADLEPEWGERWTAAQADRHNEMLADDEMHLAVEEGDVRVAADLTRGVRRLMAAWRESVGLDDATVRGELRETYYQHLSRRQGKRIVDWASRYREHVSLMASHGVIIDDEQKIYQFKVKTQLTPARVELLQTATGANPS